MTFLFVIFCPCCLLVVGDARDVEGGFLFVEGHWVVLAESGLFHCVLEICQ